ncbi:MAG: class I SAM-dependent methyltransferase [Desulfobacterales bacterium]|nr:class I SAM-dependent methyltransferase [Desulfobacterales bacterium]
MFGNNSDNEWIKFGRKNPYYWVTTKDKFLDDVLNDDRKKEFFSEGRKYAQKLLKIIRRHVDPDFSPQKVLDFGCGVGRVAIPLTHMADSVVGMDVSDTMLDEAKKNARQMEIANLDFVKNDDRVEAGSFDFIHSIYVFQHIPWPRGRKILERMLDRLDPGGIISIQFLISNTLPPKSRLKYWMKVHLPFVKNIHNLLHRKEWGTPMMQLNAYNLNRITDILRRKGCNHLYLRPTKEGRYRGMIVIAQKNPAGAVKDFIDLGDIP